MVDFQIKDKYDVADFRRIMEILRSPGGCPWDAEQTHQSIRRNVIEEAYELAQAIDTGDGENLREELGDLLMQVIFHARMEEELGHFDLDDVADTACKKLIFRHPHVFGSEVCENSEEVLVTWDAAKRIEKGQKTLSSAMEGVAETLPALMRAEKVQKKAADGNEKDFGTAMKELGAAAHGPGGAENMEKALGDLLYAAVAVARSAGVDAEQALHGACARAIEDMRLEEKCGEH